MAPDNDDDDVEIHNSWNCAFGTGISPFFSLRGNDYTTPGVNVWKVLSFDDVGIPYFMVIVTTMTNINM